MLKVAMAESKQHKAERNPAANKEATTAEREVQSPRSNRALTAIGRVAVTGLSAPENGVQGVFNHFYPFAFSILAITSTRATTMTEMLLTLVFFALSCREYAGGACESGPKYQV